MAYCTITDIQTLNSDRTYDTNSHPTATQVSSQIDLIAAELDAILAGRNYTVPVTTPAWLVNILKTINAYGAASLIETSMFPEGVDKGSSPHWKVLSDKYEAWKAKLESGSITSDFDASMPGSIFNDPNTDQEDYPEPNFTINKVY